MPPKKDTKKTKTDISSDYDFSDSETNKKPSKSKNNTEIVKQRLMMIVDILDVSEDDDSKVLIKRIALVKKQLMETLTLI